MRVYTIFEQLSVKPVDMLQNTLCKDSTFFGSRILCDENFSFFRKRQSEYWKPPRSKVFRDML